nr:hypothetical protein [uncultured Cohaesibacter sp.]
MKTPEPKRKRDAVFMVFFFAICLLLSSVVLVFQVGFDQVAGREAVIGSVTSSVLGCSAAYIRKIYLDLYNGSFLPVEADDDARFAAFIYFYTRPLLSFPIGFAVYFIWMSGLNVSIQGRFELSGSGILLLWAICIIAGFNTGKIIDVTVAVGQRVQGKIRGEV